MDQVLVPPMTDQYPETNLTMLGEKQIPEEEEVFNCCQVSILDRYQDQKDVLNTNSFITIITI